MDRRRFLVTSLAGALTGPLAVDGQVSTKIARIGMLRSENRPLDERIRQNIADVRAGLQDEGYTEGQHYRIDYYSPTSKVDVVKIARTLVRDKVDVIHAIAHVAIEAARKATTTIPMPDSSLRWPNRVATSRGCSSTFRTSQASCWS